MIQFTADEKKILSLILEAWNTYDELPVLHFDDRHEFAHAIHAAQNIVISRVVLRDEANEEN